MNASRIVVEVLLSSERTIRECERIGSNPALKAGIHAYEG
jgi:hypothetical protein